MLIYLQYAHACSIIKASGQQTYVTEDATAVEGMLLHA